MAAVRCRPEGLAAVADDLHDCPHGRSGSRRTMGLRRGRICSRSRGLTAAGLADGGKVVGHKRWKMGGNGKATFRRFNGAVSELTVQRRGTKTRASCA